MEAKHSARAAAGRGDADWSEPRRAPAEDTAAPTTMADAVANVREGLPVTWARTFDQHTRDDGTTFYVDTATGVMHDTIPTLHSADGTPV